MLTERLALTTVLLCIGILLLSACGLPLGPTARVRPAFLAGNFNVYGPDQTLLAVGRLEQTTDPAHIEALLVFQSPGCLRDQRLNLVGALNPTLTFHNASGAGMQVLLRSTTAPIYEPYAIRVLPFKGVLTLTGSCADRTTAVQVMIQ